MSNVSEKDIFFLPKRETERDYTICSNFFRRLAEISCGSLICWILSKQQKKKPNPTRRNELKTFQSLFQNKELTRNLARHLITLLEIVVEIKNLLGDKLFTIMILIKVLVWRINLNFRNFNEFHFSTYLLCML